MSSFQTPPLLASALQLADAGAWNQLASLLEPFAEQRPVNADLSLLYTEALMRRGQERSALSLLRSLEGELSEGPDRGAYRRALNMIGSAHWSLGELDEANVAYGLALELANWDGDPLEFAKATNNMGLIANIRGQFHVAMWNYRLALPTLQRLGQPRRLAECYLNMARTLRDLGQLEEADEHELKAIEFAENGVAPRLASMGRVGRAEVALLRGDARFAETTAALAAAQLECLADPIDEADAHRVVGVARTVLGNVQGAMESFARALAIAREHGHALNVADALRDRAQLRLRIGERALAHEDVRGAIAIFDRLGAASESAKLQSLLA